MEVLDISIEERKKRLFKKSDETYKEMVEKLNEHGRVLMVRPTGFGKTYLLVKLLKEYVNRYPNKKVLYLYPMNIIRAEIESEENGYMEDGIIADKNKVTMMTYSAFNNKAKGNKIDGDVIPEIWREELRNNYSLVILDEAHRAGAERFTEAYEGFKDVIGKDGVHMVGATATPERMDAEEEGLVLNKFFGGIELSEFTLFDAFREGIMPPISAVQAVYDVSELKEMLGKRHLKGIEGKLAEGELNVQIGLIAKEIGNAPRIIYEKISEEYDLDNPEETYFKFIVFFNDINDMRERGPVVCSYFESALNNIAKHERNKKSVYDTEDRKKHKEYKINPYYIASNNPDNCFDSVGVYKKDTSDLNDIKRGKRTHEVDLFMTVNMINEGYHVDDVSGVLMMRGTRSETIFLQQLGRALSVMAVKRPLVFDFANNFGSKFYYKYNNIDNKEESKKGSQGNYNVADEDSKDKKTYLQEYLDDVGFKDIWDMTHRKLSSKVKLGADTIEWMYVEKKMPISVIASDTGLSIRGIIKALGANGVKIEHEDNMYDLYEDIINQKVKNNEEIDEDEKVFKYIYSRKVLNKVKQKKCTKRNAYTVIQHLLGRRARG